LNTSDSSSINIVKIRSNIRSCHKVNKILGQTFVFNIKSISQEKVFDEKKLLMFNKYKPAD